jgi:hypothetical protein
MPTAVLMGMGLTPTLAQAKDKPSTKFSGDRRLQGRAPTRWRRRPRRPRTTRPHTVALRLDESRPADDSKDEPSASPSVRTRRARTLRRIQVPTTSPNRRRPPRSPRTRPPRTPSRQPTPLPLGRPRRRIRSTRWVSARRSRTSSRPTRRRRRPRPRLPPRRVHGRREAPSRTPSDKAEDPVKDTADKAEDTVKDVTDAATDAAEDTADKAEDAADDATASPSPSPSASSTTDPDDCPTATDDEGGVEQGIPALADDPWQLEASSLTAQGRRLPGRREGDDRPTARSRRS